jgi:hypothetical protein
MSKHPTLPYVAPFAAFMVFIALAHWLPVSPRLLYPVRVWSSVWCSHSRGSSSIRAGNWLGLWVGIAVFVLWIAPDVSGLHIAATGCLTTRWSARPGARSPRVKRSVFLVFRIFGSVLLVPVLGSSSGAVAARWFIRPDEGRLGYYTLLVLGDSWLLCRRAWFVLGRRPARRHHLVGMIRPADWRTASWRTRSPTVACSVCALPGHWQYWL